MIAFNVYPRGGSTTHYRVLVFPSRKAMYAYREVSTPRVDKGAHGRFRYEAITKYRHRTAFGIVLDGCGEIHFHQQFVGVGVVAHEMTHAARYFLESVRRMKPGSRRWDETMARCVGDLCRQFWTCYYRVKR